MVRKLDLDSNTADVIRNLRDEANQDGDVGLVELCNSALRGNTEHLAHCVGVVIDAGNGPSNWSLYDESNEPLSSTDLGITAVEYDKALLESLTCGQEEGWIALSNGRRVYAQ